MEDRLKVLILRRLAVLVLFGNALSSGTVMGTKVVKSLTNFQSQGTGEALKRQGLDCGGDESSEGSRLGAAAPTNFLCETVRLAPNYWARQALPQLAILNYLTGISMGAPFSLTITTKNFAGFVWLAFRPTT